MLNSAGITLSIISDYQYASLCIYENNEVVFFVFLQKKFSFYCSVLSDKLTSCRSLPETGFETYFLD